jgi:uncharacterized protein YndB with AHSA1/START domain
MPTTRASRTIAAPVGELWELLLDPHHLPRWWPRVTRVEDVAEGAFTEVMKTKKGKLVRLDFDVRSEEATHTLTWVQRIAGTPFASVLTSAETELRLTPKGEAATEVAIELRQQMGRHRTADRGYTGAVYMRAVPRFGAPLVRRASAATLEQALDGLERVSG